MEQKSSRFSKWFAVEERGTTIGDEIRAGTILFWTFGYSILLTSQILHQMPILSNANQLASFDATFLSAGTFSAVATALAGIFGNLPVAIGPSAGSAAFLAMGLSPDGASYEESLSFCVIAGIVLTIPAIVGLYSQLTTCVLPEPVKWSLVASQQGLLVALVGVLWIGGGVFFATPHPTGQPTIIENKQEALKLGLQNNGPFHWNSNGNFIHRAHLPFQSNDTCMIPTKGQPCGSNNDGTSEISFVTQSLTGLVGLLIAALMQLFGRRGSVLVGTTLVTLVLWAVDHFTAFGNRWFLHEYSFSEWAQVPRRVIDAFHHPGVLGWSSLLPILALVVCCAVENWGAVVGLSNVGELANLGLHTANHEPNGSRARTWLLAASSIGTIGAGLTGCSPLVVRLESAVGIAEGGRTGICALVTAGWMIAFLLLTPLMRLVPLAAMAPVAILVGSSTLFSALRFVHWESALHTLPAFLVLMTTILSARVDLALGVGLVVYAVLGLVASKCCTDRGVLHVHREGASAEDTAAAFFGVPVSLSEYAYDSDVLEDETEVLLPSSTPMYGATGKREGGNTSPASEFEI